MTKADAENFALEWADRIWLAESDGKAALWRACHTALTAAMVTAAGEPDQYQTHCGVAALVLQVHTLLLHQDPSQDSAAHHLVDVLQRRAGLL